MNDKFSRKIFCDGMRDGFPIALGYFAVSFSLGIAARHAGFTPMQGFLASLLNNASAGEYAAFTLVAAQATYLEVAIINRLRYHCRKCIATACCQRTERCLIRHVFSHHYSSCPEKQDCGSAGGHQLCPELCLQLSSRRFFSVGRYQDYFIDRDHLRCGSDPVPGKTGCGGSRSRESQ